MRYLSLILKSGLRNRRRSVLTIASLAVSLCVLGMLMALYRGLFLAGPATPGQALRLVVHHRVSITQPMPRSYEQRIRQIPGVHDVQIWQWFGGTYKDERDQRNFFPRLAVEPDHLFTIIPEISMPDDEKKAFQHERTACIVGTDLAAKFGWHIGDRITLKGDIFPGDYELKIVGVYTNPLDSTTLYFNEEYINQTLISQGSGRADSVGAFQLIADSTSDVPRITKTIDDMFDNSPAPTRTETEQSFFLSFASFLGNLKLFLMAISAAITFTILLVCANTISMSVRERVREIGVLKTLGFTRESILGIILGEATTISIIGGAIGAGLAALLCIGARHAPGGMGFTNGMVMTPAVVLACVVTAAAIGIVSSVVPAWAAARTPIVETLRHTG